MLTKTTTITLVIVFSFLTSIVTSCSGMGSTQFLPIQLLRTCVAADSSLAMAPPLQNSIPEALKPLPEPSPQAPIPLDNSMILVPQNEMDALVRYGQSCRGGLDACNKLVRLQDNYILDADKQINDLSTSLKDSKNSFKPNLWTIIPITFAVGLTSGLILK